MIQILIYSQLIFQKFTSWVQTNETKLLNGLSGMWLNPLTSDLVCFHLLSEKCSCGPEVMHIWRENIGSWLLLITQFFSLFLSFLKIFYSSHIYDQHLSFQHQMSDYVQKEVFSFSVWQFTFQRKPSFF